MRIVQAVGNLGEYYDRAAENVSLAWLGDNVPPHAGTDRVTYTVPDGKKALLVGVSLWMYRYSLATTVGRVRMGVVCYFDNGTEGDIVDIFHYTNDMTESVSVAVPISMVLLPGDRVAIFTYDPSTGGSMTYMGTCLIYEFA